MKKVLCKALVFAMMLILIWVPSDKTYAASLSMSVSASSVDIGDTVKVTVKAPSGTTATVDVYFSTDLFSFVDATGTANAAGGTVATTLGEPFSDSITVTLKAKTSGTATISAKAIKAGDSETGEEVSLGGASASVEIKNQAPSEPEKPDNGGEQEGETDETPKSADNSLASLKLSSGKLSPAFKYNTTRYTATVGYDVTSVIVSAKTSNAKATIESVTGDGTVALSVGENTIKVVVKAENGLKATYTIVVTRQAQGAEEEDEPASSEGEDESEVPESESEIESDLEWNGETLHAPEVIPEDKIPEDFTVSSMILNNEEVQALSFANGDLTVLYLENQNGNGSLFVYDEADDSIYPFVKLIAEKTYVMVLMPNDADAPDGYAPCTLSIEGKGIVNAYQYTTEAGENDFYLIYCMNNKGESGWYQYDSVEATFQRYLPIALTEIDAPTYVVDDVPDLTEKYHELEKELKAAKNMQFLMMCIAIFSVAVLLIVIINIVLRKRMDDMDDYEEYDDDYEEDPEEEEIPMIVEEIPATEEEVEDDSDEMEIEFYEMPAKELEAEEPKVEDDDEIEIEFYEMPTEELEAEALEVEETEKAEEIEEIEEAGEVEDDDEIEIEFYEMPTEEQVVDETIASIENAISKTIEAEIKGSLSNNNVVNEEDDDDDDLEFIDL